jgi:hypothetical protein
MRLRTAILALACATACLADTLTLRDGQVVQGTYMGGTARTVKMQVDDTVKTYDVTDIATLQFTPPAPTASASGSSAAPGRRTGAAARKAPRTRRSAYEASYWQLLAFGIASAMGLLRAKTYRGGEGGQPRARGDLRRSAMPRLRRLPAHDGRKAAAAIRR